MIAKFFDLKNKKVIITGGSSGIGAEIVKKFCEQDSEVFFLDINENCAENLIKDIKNFNLKEPNFFFCDLQDITKLRSILQKIGNTHVLINNAGNDDRHTLEDITEKYFIERLNLNLKHYFFASQAVLKYMTEIKSGSIINLSSVSWIRAANTFSLYASAKSAIIGLTRSLAKEFGKYNIRVNAILPGSIATERQKELWLKSNLKDEILDLQCIKRQLLPADVANLALYLASDVSSGCTKQNFIVDGGLT